MQVMKYKEKRLCNFKKWTKNQTAISKKIPFTSMNKHQSNCFLWAQSDKIKSSTELFIKPSSNSKANEKESMSKQTQIIFVFHIAATLSQWLYYHQNIRKDRQTSAWNTRKYRQLPC